MLGDPHIHLCSVPECGAFGPWGFRWGALERWACREHRERGRVWLARVKGEAHQAAPQASNEGENLKREQGALL